MGGILDFLKAAVPGAAAARVGYMQGQDQEADKQRQLERQGMLDKLKQAMDQSTIDENESRADYYRNGGAGGDGVTYVRDGSGGYTALPKRMRPGTGGAGAGASSSGSAGAETVAPPSDNDGGRAGDAEAGARAAGSTPKAPSTSLGIPTGVTAPPPRITPPRATAAPHLARAGVVNPDAGTIEDVFSDGSRKTVRKATPAEIARATHVPGVGTGAGAGSMKPNVKEAYLQSVADRAIAAAGGDVQQAEATVQNDPEGQKAYSNGLATRHFQAAKAKYDRQGKIDADLHPGTMDTTAASGPPPKDGKPSAKPAAPAPAPSAVRRTTPAGGFIDTLKTAVAAPTPNYPGASRATGKPGDVNLDEKMPAASAPSVPPADAAVQRAQAAKEAVELSKSPRVQQALTVLRSKKGTLEQLEQSGNFTPREKAYIKAAFATTPSTP